MPGSSGISAADEQSAEQELAGVDQTLTQTGSDLGAVDQAGATGESDVPTN